LNDFIGLLKNIIEDEVITADEIDILDNWLDENDSLCDRYPLDTAKTAIDMLLCETITPYRLEELKNLFKELSDPHFCNDIENEAPELDGKLICLSGEFEYGTKAEVNKKLEALGAIMQSNVTSKTNYLIVGGEGSSNWAAGTYGSKIKKALDLQHKGHDIKIYGERDLFPLL
jgi:NAD-dependent DNA ligase